MLAAQKIVSPSVFVKKRKPKSTVVYDTYWQFAAKRQEIFFSRVNGDSAPWTNDPILSQYKFTNAYRASDRVSQYLIQHVINSGIQKPSELFFRIILFKLFNKIETWEALKKEIGEIWFENYSFKKYDSVLKEIKTEGAIYSGAYIMASGRSYFGHPKKHQNHLRLLEKMMKDNFPKQIQKLKNMEALYDAFMTYPTIGPFLAYQFTIDINYSALTSFSEMEFVKAGPGAKDGIKKCFSDLGEYSEEDVIKMMADRQDEEFKRLDLDFKNLWGRPLQLIDCQNLFCEVDKYSRVAHPEIAGISNRTRIKQRFVPTLKSIQYVYPEKWGINPKATIH